MSKHQHIGDAIKAARIKKKLSQDELALRVGAKGGRFTVIRWEQGLHKPTEYVESLVRELGLDARLFDEDEEAASISPLTRDLDVAIRNIVRDQVQRVTA